MTTTMKSNQICLNACFCDSFFERKNIHFNLLLYLSRQRFDIQGHENTGLDSFTPSIAFSSFAIEMRKKKRGEREKEEERVSEQKSAMAMTRTSPSVFCASRSIAKRNRSSIARVHSAFSRLALFFFASVFSE